MYTCTHSNTPLNWNLWSLTSLIIYFQIKNKNFPTPPRVKKKVSATKMKVLPTPTLFSPHSGWFLNICCQQLPLCPLAVKQVSSCLKPLISQQLSISQRTKTILRMNCDSWSCPMSKAWVSTGSCTVPGPTAPSSALSVGWLHCTWVPSLQCS